MRAARSIAALKSASSGTDRREFTSRRLRSRSTGSLSCRHSAASRSSPVPFYSKPETPMFGPKCARIVRRKLEAARIEALTANTAGGDDVIKFDPLSANVGSMSRKPTAVTAVARQCLYCPTDVSALPDSKVCEKCSGEKNVCQRCNHKLGITPVKVSHTPRVQPTGPRTAPAPAHPLVTTAPRKRSGDGTKSASAGSASPGTGSGGRSPRSELPMPTHDEISLRAYHIWLATGCTHGHDQSDWEQARQQLLSERSLVEHAA
jgi:hypothetical protein